MTQKIDSEIGINLDVSKITGELNKLEKKLGDVSSATVEAEKSANEYKLAQAKVKAALEISKKEIDLQAQALKTQAATQKAAAESSKAAALEKKNIAILEQENTKLITQNNIKVKNDLKRTSLAQEKSQKDLENVMRQKELAHKKEALSFRQAQAKIRDEARRTRDELESSRRGFDLLRNAVAAIGVGVAAKGFINLADRAQFLENRIKVSTSSIDEMNSSLEELRKLSRETGSSLENNAILFQRLAIASESLGATNQDMLKLTKTVANLGRLSGSSTEDMKNATRQLAQALGNTKLQAEEFNSVIDQMPELVQVVAKEMGYTSAEFGNAVRTGKILSKDVYDALIKKADEVNDRASKLPLTFGQAKEVLNNELIIALGEVNKQLGVTRVLAGGMKALADNSALLTSMIKGTIVAVGTLTAAWAAYTTVVTLADLRTKQFALNFGPAGWIAAGVATVAGLALSWSLFNDELKESKLDAAGLADELRKASTSADVLALKKSQLAQMDVMYKKYEDLIAKKKQLESDPEALRNTGAFSGRRSSAGEQLDQIKSEIKEIGLEMFKLDEIITASTGKIDLLKGVEGAKKAEEETKAEIKKFEQIKKSLDTEVEGAIRVFEEKNKYIQKSRKIDSQERARLVAANAEEFNLKMKDISDKENADKNSREKKYLDIVEGYKSERQLLLENREAERAIIEEFAIGDDKEGKLQALQDYYIQRLAIIEENEQAEVDTAKKIKEQKDLAEFDKFGAAGKALKDEYNLRVKYGQNTLKYNIGLGKGMLSSLAQTSKKAFEINKAWQIGEALINGFGAIQKALNNPFPANIAIAAMVAAQTAAQIQGIRSATFGGGGGSPTAPSGSVGASSQESAQSASAVAPAVENIQNVSIAVDVGDLDDDGLYSGKAIRKITEEIAKQIESGVTNVRFA